MHSKGSTRRISGALDDFLRSSGLHSGLSEKELLLHWKDVVGEALAREIELVDVKEGILLLRTQNAAWKAEIFLEKKTLLDKANRLLKTNTFRDVRFI